jgi:flavin-dependent dehydrogenase
MDDVLIVGAGPAGSVAGAVLARAGARVRIVDRASFPRPKLCGDTVNPGTLACLYRLGIGEDVDAHGLRVDGMLITGEGGVAIEGRYPNDLHGRAIVRRDLDWLLLQRAIAAGCRFDPAVRVSGASVGTAHGTTVRGVTIGRNGSTREIRAAVTIAADGRHSTLAFALGLARHPKRPRRWAIGAYYSDVPGPGQGPTGDDPLRVLRAPRSPAAVFGEMHVRAGRYIGVAPVPGGLTNVCLVKPSAPGDGDLRDPAALLERELACDPLLRDRFAGACLVGPPTVLGPLAVDSRAAHVTGLLLAGDAAGFIDPMTGDGLRFAIRGGELAALAALEALEHGWSTVHARHAARRSREFASKWRFNRALRALVASPAAVSVAALGARMAPAVMRSIVARAGDCDLAAALS